MSFSSSSSSGSERKKDVVVVVVVVVSDVLKDEGGFDDDPVVARLPRLDDFWTRLLLLDISKLKVLFPRHHRLAVASPSSSSPLLSPSARRNRLAGVLYAKGSRHKVLFSFSSLSCKVNTVLMGLSKVVTVVFPDDFDPPFVLSSSSTMNCQNRSHNNTPLPVVCDDDSDDDDDFEGVLLRTFFEAEGFVFGCIHFFKRGVYSRECIFR